MADKYTSISVRRHGYCLARVIVKKMSEIRFWHEKSILRRIRYNISFFRERKKLRENFLLAHSLLDTPSRDQIHDGNVFMKTNNLKNFTNAYFSLFLILSYDLAANSLSRKKNWIVFAVENIKNIDFGDFFRKHEKNQNVRILKNFNILGEFDTFFGFSHLGVLVGVPCFSHTYTHQNCILISEISSLRIFQNFRKKIMKKN